MSHSPRTDRALQEFLDSLSQLPGSIIYRDDYIWKGLPPGNAGQVLSLDNQSKPIWIDAPTPTGFGIAGIQPINWYEPSLDGWNNGDVVTKIIDRGSCPSNIDQRNGTPVYDASTGAIRFDGLSDALRGGNQLAPELPQTVTTVMVAEIHNIEPGGYIYDADNFHGTGNRQVLARPSSGNTNLSLWAGQYAPGPNNSTFPKSIIINTFDGADSWIQINNTRTITGNPGSNASHGFTFGSRFSYSAGTFSTIDLYEVARVGYTLSDDAINTLISDLAEKYAITI